MSDCSQGSARPDASPVQHIGRCCALSGGSAARRATRSFTGSVVSNSPINSKKAGRKLRARFRCLRSYAHAALRKTARASAARERRRALRLHRSPRPRPTGRSTATPMGATRSPSPPTGRSVSVTGSFHSSPRTANSKWRSRLLTKPTPKPRSTRAGRSSTQPTIQRDKLGRSNRRFRRAKGSIRRW